MIDSVRIRDFQSHKDNFLKFHPLFNIIIGPSGNGKSSVLRAIKYTAFNNPGTSEVRWPDAKTYRVDLCVNGKTIKRTKGTGTNSYQIDTEPILADVNRDVPPTVQNALNIHTIQLDTSSDLNVQFADQLDGPFMLGAKDAIKMKFLNVLSGTNAVDLAAKRSVALVKENTKIEKDASVELALLEDQEQMLVKKLEQIKQINKFVKEKNEMLQELLNMRKPVYDVLDKLNYLEAEYKKVKVFENYVEKLDLDSLLEKISKYSDLLTLQKRYISLKELHTNLTNKIKHVNSINTAELLTKINKLEQLKKVSADRDALKDRYFALKSVLMRLDEQVNTNIAEYITALNKAKICPVCGNELTEECLDNIKKTL